MKVKKIISGGQTGGDQAGLAFGKEVGLLTGGWIPKGWRTDEGPRPDFKDLYGLKEDASYLYPPRTEKNVVEAQATIIFGNPYSPGCSLTRQLCLKHHRPYLAETTTNDIIDFFNTFEIINIAGNRERTNPGIFQSTLSSLLAAWKGVCGTCPND